MACVMWKACRVLLLMVGGVLVTMAARGVGGAGAGAENTDFVSTPNHIGMCETLMDCTSWCESCVARRIDGLFDELNNCQRWSGNLTGYKYPIQCQNQQYQVCVCTTKDASCKRCRHSEQNNLLCFSQADSGSGVYVWDEQLNNHRQSLPLEQMCPTCSCATNAPTTPKPPTTQPAVPTMYLGEKVKPRIVTTSVPATTGSTPVQVSIAVYVAVGGVVLVVILVLVGFVCWRKRYRSKPTRKTAEQEYADIDEMITLRNQGSMMRSNQQLDSNGAHLPRGHRTFNNEMYGLQVTSNGSTSPQQPPTLPGNHPPPSNAAPPAAYQPLDLAHAGPAPGGAGGAGQPCPHCHHPAPDRSATAPFLSSDRPAQLDGPGGARSPYMPLLKNNTCPSPATPQEEPVCRCHARPLSECSSMADSLPSDRRGGTATTAAPGDDRRPLSDASDAQESPYYFKMQQQQPEAVPSPASPTPQYFKLEDAKTLPLEAEMSPLLADPDSNGNSVLMKPVPNGPEVAGEDEKGEPRLTTRGPCEPADVGPLQPRSAGTPARTVSLSADTVEVNPGGKHTTV